MLAAATNNWMIQPPAVHNRAIQAPQGRAALGSVHRSRLDPTPLQHPTVSLWRALLARQPPGSPQRWHGHRDEYGAGLMTPKSHLGVKWSRRRCSMPRREKGSRQSATDNLQALCQGIIEQRDRGSAMSWTRVARDQGSRVWGKGSGPGATHRKSIARA